MNGTDDVLALHHELSPRDDSQFERLYNEQEVITVEMKSDEPKQPQSPDAVTDSVSIAFDGGLEDGELAATEFRPDDGDIELELNDDDDDENDEDNVHIKIKLDGQSEEDRLKNLLDMDMLNNIPIICNKNYSYHKLDLEICSEVEKLVRLSISPSTDKHVAILIDNQLLLVPVNVRISDRLASYVWGNPRTYSPSILPYIEEYNRLLVIDTKRSETFGMFSVRYSKTNYIKMNNGNQQPTMCGLHQYHDFAMIVVSGNRVVDYAIHGYKSNIVEMVARHKLSRIYYNAKNESLTHFLEYKCQPFFACLDGRLHPVKIREPPYFNTLPFCERNDIFCALCRGLKELRGFLNYPSAPATVNIPQTLYNFKPIPKQHHHQQQRQSPLTLQSQQPLPSQSSSSPQQHQEDQLATAAHSRSPRRRWRRRRSRELDGDGGGSSSSRNNDWHRRRPRTCINRRSQAQSPPLASTVPSSRYIHSRRVRNIKTRYRHLRDLRRLSSFNSNIDF